MKYFRYFLLPFLFLLLLLTGVPCYAQQGGGFPPSVKTPIKCLGGSTCAVGSIQVGQSAMYIQNNPTTITSNATLALSDIEYTNLPAGYYFLSIAITMNATGGGSQMSFLVTGQGGDMVYYLGGTALGGSASSAGFNGTALNLSFSGSNGDAYSLIGNVESLSSTTGNNIWVEWAQSTSSASSTTFCNLPCSAILTRLQ